MMTCDFGRVFFRRFLLCHERLKLADDGSLGFQLGLYGSPYGSSQQSSAQWPGRPQLLHCPLFRDEPFESANLELRPSIGGPLPLDLFLPP
jgi:hypothetical protein